MKELVAEYKREMDWAMRCRMFSQIDKAKARAEYISDQLKEQNAVFYYINDIMGKPIKRFAMRSGIKSPDRTKEARELKRMFNDGEVFGYGWTREVNDFYRLTDEA